MRELGIFLGIKIRAKIKILSFNIKDQSNDDFLVIISIACGKENILGINNFFINFKIPRFKRTYTFKNNIFKNIQKSLK